MMKRGTPIEFIANQAAWKTVGKPPTIQFHEDTCQHGVPEKHIGAHFQDFICRSQINTWGFHNDPPPVVIGRLKHLLKAWMLEIMYIVRRQCTAQRVSNRNDVLHPSGDTLKMSCCQHLTVVVTLMSGDTGWLSRWTHSRLCYCKHFGRTQICPPWVPCWRQLPGSSLATCKVDTTSLPMCIHHNPLFSCLPHSPTLPFCNLSTKSKHYLKWFTLHTFSTLSLSPCSPCSPLALHALSLLSMLSPCSPCSLLVLHALSLFSMILFHSSSISILSSLPSSISGNSIT